MFPGRAHLYCTLMLLKRVEIDSYRELFIRSVEICLGFSLNGKVIYNELMKKKCEKESGKE